ncbi:MAG: prolipoprotein diacylglyceryl transferase [Lachnospiraceae bacterium]
MNTSINFPNLHIYLSNVGQKINIKGFTIAYYGIIISLAILVGIIIACKEARRTGQNQEDYLDLALFAVLFSIVGARLYYVVFSWDLYKDNLLSIFNLRQGGLAIFGAIIGAVITVIIFAKAKHLSFPQMLDTGCLGLVTGQIIGRWGNFFNREAFGDYTNGLFAMQLPVDAVRNHDISENLAQHIQTINGTAYIQAHPTFLYESVWNLVLLVILLLVRDKKKFQGELFVVYLFGYALGRVWIEGLRTDPLLIPGMNFPVSQALSILLMVVCVVIFIIGRRNSKKCKIK